MSTTRTMWLAFDIGCLECGESSKVIGVFDTEEQADAACKAARRDNTDWNGQHCFEVFEIKIPGVQHHV